VHATPELAWLVLAAIAAFGLTHVLRALAIRVRNEIAMHDLRVRVADLQTNHYHATMRRLGIPRRGEGPAEPGEVIEVGETLEEATPIGAPEAAEVAEVAEPQRQAA